MSNPLSNYNEYLGTYQYWETRKGISYSVWMRDGEIIEVRQMEENPFDPRSKQDFEVHAQEDLAWRDQIEKEREFNRKYSR